MFELIQTNFVAVAITSFLILFILTNNNFDIKTNRLFLAASSCVLILIVEEAWEAQLALASEPSLLRVILSAIGYSLRPMTAYFLVLMVGVHDKKHFAMLSAPLVINSIVSFSSLFSPISFSYSATNDFIRGPLGYTPFIVSAVYVVYLLHSTIKLSHNGNSMEALIVSAIVLLAFSSTVMESVFGFRFIQNPCIATSITYYYLFLHSNKNNRDPLTGALSRRRFYYDAQKYESNLTAVISLDLNNLKTLNDKFGHTAGDNALKAVSGILHRYTGKHIALYRTGGDEFMLLCYKMDNAKVEAIIGNIRSDLEKTKYRCAIGYTKYTHGMNFDYACQIADNHMYDDKRRMKNSATEHFTPLGTADIF